MRNTILCGDVRERLRDLPDESVHCVVTSPPYWGLRDYGTASWEGGDPDHAHRVRDERSAAPGSAKQASSAGANYVAAGDCLCGARRIDSQLGLEPTPEEYVASMVAVFREVRRVLRKDGTLWLNLGDSYTSGGRDSRDVGNSSGIIQHGDYSQGLTEKGKRAPTPAGLKAKDLVGIPWRVAFALQADGWWLRSDIIWSKPNPMPESVTDRPTKAHEYIFLLSKSQTYYYDAEAIKEGLAESSIQRISQPTFEKQTGGPKDYGPDSNRSVRKALENFRSSHMVETPRNDGDRWREAAGGDAPRGTRNRRTVWEIPTEPYEGAHFATFPTMLVKPCILAGTSEHGVCSECGAPWVRQLERVSTGKSYAVGKSAEKRSVGLATGFSGYDDGSSSPVFKTAGWRPTCKHEAPTEAALVLDPFMGSGTTGLVAKTAGRDYVGVELNPQYIEIAKRRINVEQDRLL